MVDWPSGRASRPIRPPCPPGSTFGHQAAPQVGTQRQSGPAFLSQPRGLKSHALGMSTSDRPSVLCPVVRSPVFSPIAATQSLPWPPTSLGALQHSPGSPTSVPCHLRLPPHSGLEPSPARLCRPPRALSRVCGFLLSTAAAMCLPTCGLCMGMPDPGLPF